MDRNDRTTDRRTNIVLDEEPVDEAMRLTGTTTKRQVVDMAFRELVKRKKRRDLMELAGKIQFHDAFDPKAGLG